VNLDPSIIYFDNSALSRLSDPSVALAMEATAVGRIVRACQTDVFRILSSDVLEAEASNAPPLVFVVSSAVLQLARLHVSLADSLSGLRHLQRLGLHTADALHLAAAYTGSARYFITVDDHFLRRARAIAALPRPMPEVVTPMELVRREGLGS
jgi:hypothetical protein